MHLISSAEPQLNVSEKMENFFMFIRVAHLPISFLCSQVSVAKRIFSICFLYRNEMNSMTASLAGAHVTNASNRADTVGLSMGLFAMSSNKDTLSMLDTDRGISMET